MVFPDGLHTTESASENFSKLRWRKVVHIAEKEEDQVFFDVFADMSKGYLRGIRLSRGLQGIIYLNIISTVDFQHFPKVFRKRCNHHIAD